MQALLRQLQIHSVISSARTPEAILRAAMPLQSGSILTLPESVPIAHENGKRAFISLDLTDGLWRDEAAVRWRAETLGADGRISETEEIRHALQADAAAVSVGDEWFGSVQ